MAQYLIQASYSSDSLAALVQSPQNRLTVVSKAIKKLGGSVVAGGMCFGDYDIVAIINLPDNTSAAACAFAIGAGGGCKSFKTTPLLSAEEAIAGMEAASELTYKPPSAS